MPEISYHLLASKLNLPLESWPCLLVNEPLDALSELSQTAKKEITLSSNTSKELLPIVLGSALGLIPIEGRVCMIFWPHLTVDRLEVSHGGTSSLTGIITAMGIA